MYTQRIYNVGMNGAIINIRTDFKVKFEAQKIAEKMGLTLSDLLNGYLREVIKVKKVAFSVSEEPSKRLINSLKEARKDLKEGWVSPAFDTAEEAIAWLNNPKAKYVRDFQPEVYKTKSQSPRKNSRSV